MTELQLWDNYWMASGSNGMWFLALSFLAWVGLRIGQNIYNNGETPIVMRVAGSVFAIFVAYGFLINFGASEWNANGIANGMAYVESTGEAISPYASELIANTNKGAAFNLMPTIPGGLFVLSLLTMQMLPMWMKK
jgi:hypothetical protein